MTALDRPASFDGKVLQLPYARAQELELEPYLDLAAAQGAVYVQFWLKPGQSLSGGIHQRG